MEGRDSINAPEEIQEEPASPLGTQQEHASVQARLRAAPDACRCLKTLGDTRWTQSTQEGICKEKLLRYEIWRTNSEVSLCEVCCSVSSRQFGFIIFTFFSF